MPSNIFAFKKLLRSFHLISFLWLWTIGMQSWWSDGWWFYIWLLLMNIAKANRKRSKKGMCREEVRKKTMFVCRRYAIVTTMKHIIINPYCSLVGQNAKCKLMYWNNKVDKLRWKTCDKPYWLPIAIYSNRCEIILKLELVCFALMYASAALKLKNMRLL